MDALPLVKRAIEGGVTFVMTPRVRARQPALDRRYAMVLAVLARSDDAVREAERACELDPLCLVVGTTAAWVRYVAGDYEAAIERCRRVLDLDPRQL